jgi:hypothetical protein
VLGFGLGLGLWHVLLLILGVTGLYYRSVMVVIAAIVILGSGRQFGTLARTVRPVWRFAAAPQAICILLVAIFAGWLLLARGLYPGGGGDYYTHYFYYYLEVLNNHSLAPNDVWYHYFYSKGYGLFFFSMLLTDPEAPALVTFCCVLMAALAMAAVVHRIAPSSLWPGCVAALYLAFNLSSYGGFGGGEFQKDHEQVSALIVLMACALCMARGPTARAWFTMAASSAVAIAIIAQPVGVLVACYFISVAFWAALRRRWKEMWRCGLIGAVVGGTVAAMLVLSYWMTGLADDQALGLMLRFADITRLERWGVLPQIVIVAWIRANYLSVAPPGWEWALTGMLPRFMRLSQLWVFSVGPAVALGFLATRWIRSRYRGVAVKTPPTDARSAASLSTMRHIGSLVLVFAIISVPAGYEQPVSYLRTSSFFFPLLALLATAACSWALTRIPGRKARLLLSWPFPLVLLVATVVLWHGDWRHRVAQDSKNSLRFFFGRYSLAEAYSRQDVGFSFGGINTHALAASRQVEPGTPIWSTNVDSYCMVPDCWIESVVSFKLSDRLDEIISGEPERSKQLLQEAGLNYFLVSGDSTLLDVLPYAKLFAPNTIGRYLAIRWTDGTAFLLTWIGPQTTPITPEFLQIYTRLLKQRELTWFRFSRLAPQLAEVTARLRNKSWGARVEFAWRQTRELPPDGTLNITEATYGENCRAYTPTSAPFNTVYRGNATDTARDACSGVTQCLFRVDVQEIGDPAGGCTKDFSITYRCGQGGPLTTVTLAPEANGRTVNLFCPATP